jgi:hypothetical protein
LPGCEPWPGLHGAITEQYGWRQAKRRQSSQRLAAGYANAELRQWRPPNPQLPRVGLLRVGAAAPPGLSDAEKTAYKGMDALYKTGSGYGLMMVTHPQTLGFSPARSPAGLAAWFDDKLAGWTCSGGDPERSLTKDAYHKLIYFNEV